MRRACVGLTLILAFASVPTPASAQWFRLPNGKLAFRTDYTSSATFVCGTWFINGSCQSTGNALILKSGASAMTISWESPTAGPLTTAWSQTHRFLVGTIRTSVNGPPFVFPTMATNPALVFQMHMAFSGPATYPGYTDPAYYSFAQGPNNSLRAAGFTNIGIFGFPFGPGGDSRGGLIWYSFKTNPTIDATSSAIDIFATTGIATAPEPATMVLFATGAAAIGAVARRRARRKGSSAGGS
jgi:hypothetical protein